jgi:hypothetical protein
MAFCMDREGGVFTRLLQALSSSGWGNEYLRRSWTDYVYDRFGNSRIGFLKALPAQHFSLT